MGSVVSLDARRPGAVRVIVNANASGVDSVRSAVRDADELFRAVGGVPVTVATRTLADLEAALAEAQGQRVVLVGGDGSLHAAANTHLLATEFALLPAGGANNVARALRIPTSRGEAARLAVFGDPASIDLLEVATRDAEMLAVEGLSAGFHADARGRYHGVNSANVRAGAAALAKALAHYRPYDIGLRVDGETRTVHTAQAFVSNMPLFGPGLRVAPAAEPDDGRADLVVMAAPSSRAGAIRELARVRNGSHVRAGHATSSRIREVEMLSEVPVVADAEVLGNGPARVQVREGALKLVRPPAAAGALGIAA